MTVITPAYFQPKALFDNSHPIGKGPKEGKERYTLFAMRDPDQPKGIDDLRIVVGTSLESLAEKSIQFMKQNPLSLLNAPRNWEDVIKSSFAAAKSDLRDITPLLNQMMQHSYVAIRSQDLGKEFKLAPTDKDAAVAFANSINELVKKRNDKIEASTWIAFLDVVLKILTFGLFHFKEGLKAPMLNPIHWANACDPNQYKFTFEKSYPALAGLIDSSNPATVFVDDLGNHQRNLFERFFTAKELPSSDGPALKALMGQVVPGSGPVDYRPIGSPWTDKEMDNFVVNMKEFSKTGTGILAAPLSRIEDAFALGHIAKGTLTCSSSYTGELYVTIAIRKTADEQYSLLVWDGKSYSYKVGAPLNIDKALPERLRNHILSFSLTPLH